MIQSEWVIICKFTFDIGWCVWILFMCWWKLPYNLCRLLYQLSRCHTHFNHYVLCPLSVSVSVRPSVCSCVTPCSTKTAGRILMKSFTKGWRYGCDVCKLVSATFVKYSRVKLKLRENRKTLIIQKNLRSCSKSTRWRFNVFMRYPKTFREIGR